MKKKSIILYEGKSWYILVESAQAGLDFGGESIKKFGPISWKGFKTEKKGFPTGKERERKVNKM